MSLEDSLIYIECTLLNSYVPSFLNVEFQQGVIYIFISCESFKHYSVSERIRSVFELLKFECGDIINTHPILVEAFDENEFQEQMKNVYRSKS